MFQSKPSPFTTPPNPPTIKEEEKKEEVTNNVAVDKEETVSVHYQEVTIVEVLERIHEKVGLIVKEANHLKDILS